MVAEDIGRVRRGIGKDKEMTLPAICDCPQCKVYEAQMSTLKSELSELRQRDIDIKHLIVCIQDFQSQQKGIHRAMGEFTKRADDILYWIENWIKKRYAQIEGKKE